MALCASVKYLVFRLLKIILYLCAGERTACINKFSVSVFNDFFHDLVTVKSYFCSFTIIEALLAGLQCTVVLQSSFGKLNIFKIRR